MASLFNRRIEVKIVTYSPSTNQPLFESLFKNTMISVQLSKSRDFDVENTGVIGIKNISIENTQSFTDVLNPFFLRYELRAGYGEESDFLPVISQGHIIETTWTHQGGDIDLTFFISEGAKVLQLPYKLTQERLTLPPKSNVADFLKRLEAIGQEIDYIPNRSEVLNDLRKIQFQNTRTMATGLRSALQYSLEEGGFRFFEANGKITVQRRPDPSAPASYLFRNPNLATILNFKTGMLSADIENQYDYQKQTRVAWVKFVALFIPEIFPSNAIKINEPRYPHLEGNYIVDNVSIALNNKEGPFLSSGRALHFDYRHPDASNKTTIELEREAGIRF